MSPHHDVSEAERPAPRRAGASRRVAKHRTARRTPHRGIQLVGLTAALAAAAGTAAAGFNPPTTSTAGTTLEAAQAQALTTARIERRDLASRDTTRLSMDAARQAAAETKAARDAQARAAQLATQTALTQRRAAALAAAKAKAAAAAAKAAAEKAAALAKAKADAAARAAAPKIVLPTTGYHLTARFGQGGSRWSSNHTGLDFAAPLGTPVRSVLAGEVIQAEFAGAYGRQVKVRHADGTVTSYSHMSEFTVSVGDQVSAGTQVGSIGVTGNTTGPHLHFEVLPGGGTAIDPEPWLREHGLTP